jgi:hypothetical protein
MPLVYQRDRGYRLLDHTCCKISGLWIENLLLLEVRQNKNSRDPEESAAVDSNLKTKQSEQKQNKNKQFSNLTKQR